MSEAMKPPRVAVVGCGGWGKNLVRNIAELGALETVCDPNDETARGFAEIYGCKSLSFDEVLTDAAIDGVVIAAPAELHYTLAKQALEAGKHAYVEKPLALRTEDAEALVKLAARLNRRLMVGHLLQYHPVFIALRDMVRAGELGKLRYVYSNRLNIGKLRTEEDVMWSFAPHDVSMILALMGEEPEVVDAIGSYFLNPRLADSSTVQMVFADGRTAQVFTSWLHPTKEQKLVAVGEKAMAVFDDTKPWDEKLQLFRHGVDWKDGRPDAVKADAEIVSVEQDEPLKQECLHFLESISDGRTPRTDGSEGLRVLRVLSRAATSMEKKRLAAAAPAQPASTSADAPRFDDVMIHESAYVDDGVTIGSGSKVWHFSHILGQVDIGEHCSIGQNVVVGPKVSIGDRVKIQNNVSVYEGVTLEDGVFCGPSCVFTNVNNPRAEIERKSEFLETRVKRGATIGANATIVCGHSLGAYSFIAAGAVVAKDVPDYALMAGVPARRIGWMSKAGGRLGDNLVCPIDGTRYVETGPDRLEPAAD